MKNWKKTLVSENETILQAIKIIDKSAQQIALVVDNNNKLLGTVTDGDIRRAVLKNISLEMPVKDIMCCTPYVININDDLRELKKRLQDPLIRQLPVIDDHGCIVGLETLAGFQKIRKYENPVVVMAGGLGSRLRPLTDDCPKPMLEVGGKPILKTILENFIEYGFSNFYFSINYRGEIIEKYFKDGSDWNVNINYLREEKPLGTAGSLSLLTDIPQLPFIVCNGDVLTKTNFTHLLNYHEQYSATATMCVREYDFQVPFGVAVADKHRLLEIQEKPVHQFLVNAGIYVLSPSVLTHLVHGQYCDMPTLFEKIAIEGEAAVFPIHEYWLDLGRIEDITKARGEFYKVFE